MERTHFIEHEGKRVVLLDYSGLKTESDALAEIEKSRQFIARQKPDGSLLTLTDATDAHYTSAVVAALKELADHDRPYVKAGAAVSNSRLVRVISTAVALATGRRIPVFPTREEALRWLMQQ